MREKTTTITSRITSTLDDTHLEIADGILKDMDEYEDDSVLDGHDIDDIQDIHNILQEAEKPTDGRLTGSGELSVTTCKSICMTLNAQLKTYEHLKKNASMATISIYNEQKCDIS